MKFDQGKIPEIVDDVVWELMGHPAFSDVASSMRLMVVGIAVDTLLNKERKAAVENALANYAANQQN